MIDILCPSTASCNLDLCTKFTMADKEIVTKNIANGDPVNNGIKDMPGIIEIKKVNLI